MYPKAYPAYINAKFHIAIPIVEYIVNFTNPILKVPATNDISVLAIGISLEIKKTIRLFP